VNNFFATPEVPSDSQINLNKASWQALRDPERKISVSMLEVNRWTRKRTASALKICFRNAEACRLRATR
jgi:hypothetical protein